MTVQAKESLKLPELPTRMGKQTKTKSIDGSPFYYTVVDEEVFPAISNPQKAFCLHKIRQENGIERFRIGYYMIAHKPRVKGKWVWGQYAPIMTKEEMQMIIEKARARGWL
jgi:hypothetical protein